jgi:hypothetical protein
LLRFSTLRYHRSGNEAVCKQFHWDIPNQTQPTLWSDLADRCFEGILKKSKLKTTIHHLVVGDLLGKYANRIIRHIFTTIEEALPAGKRGKYRDKKKRWVRCYGINLLRVPAITQ